MKRLLMEGAEIWESADRRGYVDGPRAWVDGDELAVKQGVEIPAK